MTPDTEICFDWNWNLSLFLILRSLNVSSVLGDVFLLMCAVSRVKISVFMAKLTPVFLLISNGFPPRTRSHSTGNQSFMVPVLDYSRASRAHSAGQGYGNEIVISSEALPGRPLFGIDKYAWIDCAIIIFGIIRHYEHIFVRFSEKTLLALF